MAKWMAQRIELAKMMRDAPSALPPLVCDYVPPCELLGIFIAHSTVTRMAMRGELDVAAATYLNAALQANAFAVFHHCTHESISQHNPMHAGFENTVFRLGAMLNFFDDGYREAHTAHHQRCQEDTDPDLVMSHARLPVLGTVLDAISGRTFVHLGQPVTPRISEALHFTGLARALLRSSFVQSRLVDYRNVRLKMACFDALDVLAAHEEYAGLRRTLGATWRNSTRLANVVLSLFFARYPHRNGRQLQRENDDFSENTYRGEGQVDLWMMGEGAHHLHHAKSDVSYARLSAICREIEAQRPDLKVASRGNQDLEALEFSGVLPPKLRADAPPSERFPTERTLRVEEGFRALLDGDAERGVVAFASAVLDSAMHCCLEADRALLRERHAQLGLDRRAQHPSQPVPISGWARSVLSDSTAATLAATRGSIGAEVERTAREVARRLPPVRSEDEFKARYVDAFVALLDATVPPSQQRLFLERCAPLFGLKAGGEGGGGGIADRTALLARLRAFLESPLPSNFLRSRRKFGAGSEAQTRRELGEMVFGARAKL